MTWAVSCHECDELVWPPYEAERSGNTEIAALRLALDHATDEGHTEVHIIPGCYYTGDEERPETFGNGVTSDDCVTPARGKLVDDIEFAIETLEGEAERFEKHAGDGNEELHAELLARNLRRRADLLDRKKREREGDSR